MAEIKALELKVQKAEEKVQKCQKTIERHQKQLEKKVDTLAKKGINLAGLSKEEIEKVQDGHRQTELSWEIYDVKSKQDDIKGATKKLAEAERILENWKAKLNVEIEKERFLEGNAPQVIKDFLEEWKNKAYQWHIKRYDDYLQFKKNLEKEEEEAKALLVKKGLFLTREQEKALKEMGLDYKSIQAKKANFAGQTVLHMNTIYNEAERLAWLEKDLEAEKKAKMLDMIIRINDVIGAITDATGLKISNVGNLNGIIIGEKGKAKVETIGAGGWNIQVFHYRTLVHKLA